MKKLINLLIFLLILNAGCTSSFIKLDFVPRSTDINQFGITGKRNFHIEEDPGDSLVLRWSSSTKGGYRNGSIVAADKYIFVSDLSGRIYCFNYETGETKGFLDYKGIIKANPVILNNTLVFLSMPRNRDYTDLIFYDLPIAKERYSTKIEGKVVTELLLLNNGVVFITNEAIIYKYGMRGEKIFGVKSEHYTSSNLLAMGDEIILLSEKGEVVFIDVNSGITLRTYQVSEEPLNNGAIESDILYFTDYHGKIYSFDLLQKRVINVKELNEKFKMTPVADEKNIYIGGLSGKFYAIDKNTLEIKWVVNTDGILNASPLVTKSRIVIPDLNKHLFIVEKERGRINVKMSFEGRVKVTPIFYKKKLFIGIDDGIINCYDTY